jgi:hypothetical protein
MKLTVDSLEWEAEKAEIMAEFSKPLSKLDIEVLRDDGFSAARGMARSCMKWVWMQWLLAGDAKGIRDKVGHFVEKGVLMRSKSDLFYMRAVADLYLLHCAIFASSQDQLVDLAARVVDASGIGDHKPEERHGELYASAWCGMLKHWILGDLRRAEEHSGLIWSAYRDASFAAASKPLVMPWLKGDWSRFIKAQRKDFEKLWTRGRKEGSVRSASDEGTLVTVQRYPLEQRWCWAHCGLAMLAHRKGIEVATDAFWFPPHALKVIRFGS